MFASQCRSSPCAQTPSTERRVCYGTYTHTGISMWDVHFHRPTERPGTPAERGLHGHFPSYTSITIIIQTYKHTGVQKNVCMCYT